MLGKKDYGYQVDRRDIHVGNRKGELGDDTRKRGINLEVSGMRYM